MYAVFIILGLISVFNSAFAAQSMPVEYEKNKTMRKLWGFANRRVEGEGWCKLSDITALIHSDPSKKRKATDTEKTDVIRAMARKVRLETKEETLRAIQQLRGFLVENYSEPFKKHFEALQDIYQILIAKKYKTPPVNSKYSDMVNKALGRYDLSAAIGPNYTRYVVEGAECSAVKFGEVNQTEFDAYMVKRQVRGLRRYAEDYATKFYNTQKAYAVGGYRSGEDIVCIDTVRQAERWNWEDKPTTQFRLSPGQKTNIIFDDKRTTQDLIRQASKDFGGSGNVAGVSYANALILAGAVLGERGSQEEAIVRHTLGQYESLLGNGKTTHKNGDGRDCYNEPLIDENQKDHRGLTRKASSVHAAEYTKNAFLVLDNDDQLNPRKEIIPANIITIAAYDLRNAGSIHYGRTGPSGPKSLTSLAIEKGTKDRIRAQFDIAIQHGHKVLITGLFGCGFFENDPQKMAEWYAELLRTEYAGQFDAVIFSTMGGNGQILKNTLQKELRQHSFDFSQW